MVYEKQGRTKLFSLAGEKYQQSAKSISRTSQSGRIRNPRGETASLKKGVEILITMGFERVGNWELAEEGIDLSLFASSQSKKILYAFVSEDRVLYIGKTIRQLNQRLYGYKNPGPTQYTNIRNNEQIYSLLSKGKEIEIYVFVPKEEIKFKGISVNLAAGLEDSLIEEIRPPWNETGK